MRPHRTDGTLSARLALRVIAFCSARGHDPARLAEDAGLSLDALKVPEARISFAEMERVGERALALTQDDAFGLHLAMDVADAGKLDNGVLLLMACPTVRVAIEKMVAYQRYWSDGERARLFPAEGGVELRYALPDARGTYARHVDECAMAEIVIGLRFLSGSQRPPRIVRFRHQRPARTHEHDALFGCPLAFDAPETAIVLDDALLDTPMRHANEIFCTVFEQQIHHAIERLPAASRQSDAVRRTLRGALAGGRCGLAETARAIGTSPRTLQRQLLDEGTTFARVVSALRREMAEAYLARGIPIAEVADLLGYADVTAFHHAYRRWTGTSPRKHRASAP